MKTHIQYLFLVVAFLAGLTQTARAVVAFTVTPAAVSNTYSGKITLLITGLTNTETVVVQKFLDLNTNGIIDGSDWLVQQFKLTDGQAGMVIGGVTNFNVPGDLNAATGAITAPLNFQNGDPAQNIIGKYVYVLSSPSGHFSPVTNLLSVTNAAYAQSFTGNVVSGVTNVPNAVVMLYTLSGFAAGTMADNSGHYNIGVAPGTYLLVAAKSNYVADPATATFKTLGVGITITTNLSLLPVTESISGKLTDASDTNAGLPGMMVTLISSDGSSTFGVTDTNGNFTVPVTPGNWRLILSNPELDFYGYLGLLTSPQIDASAGSVTGVVISLPKGTALFYGSVKDGQNNPLPGVKLFGYNGGGPFTGDATTDQNGDYVVAVNNGVWHAHIDYTVPSYVNYIFSSGLADTTISNGEAVLQNFVGLLATNQITGYVIDGNHHPIGSVGVFASADINGYGFAAPSVLTDSNGFYTLMVANGDWNVAVNCSTVPNNALKSFGYACVNDQAINIFNNNGVVNFTPIPIPILGSPAWGLGRFQMQLLHSVTGQNYTVQMSTNLSSANWISLFITNNALTNSFLVTDPNATNKQRFYRILIGQ